MKSQLYFQPMTRDYLKSEIASYVEIYFQKLVPVFNDIENEADKYANDFYNDFMNQPASDDFVDPSSIAEKALEIGIEHFSYLKLGKYYLTANWHATLYQLWEQQLRLFLFKEMSHVYALDFKSFCTSMDEIRKNLAFHNVNFESFACWPRIIELRLLCNVIKHGEGNSAEQLRKINPALFRKEPALFDIKREIDYMDIYKTTLLEETLNINEMTLQDYKGALISFWDEIPERNYSNEL